MNAYLFVHHLHAHYSQIQSFLRLIQHTNAMAFESHHPRLLRHLKSAEKQEKSIKIDS